MRQAQRSHILARRRVKGEEKDFTEVCRTHAASGTQIVKADAVAGMPGQKTKRRSDPFKIAGQLRRVPLSPPSPQAPQSGKKKHRSGDALFRPGDTVLQQMKRFGQF